MNVFSHDKSVVKNMNYVPLIFPEILRFENRKLHFEKNALENKVTIFKQ